MHASYPCFEELSSGGVAAAVARAIPHIAFNLREDYLETLLPMQQSHAEVSRILENAEIAAREEVPLCQDTGSVWVYLEVGRDCKSVSTDIFSKVDGAVASAYEENVLRMSMLHDSFSNRTNTKNNTPAFCEISFVDDKPTTLHVMLKGAGSDNASKLTMLSPLGGREAIVREIVEHVREKAANACPPLVVGIGIGGTFDKVAALSKRALLRDIREPAANSEVTNLEVELLDALAPYALAVNVETAPSHIAALPLAINLGCCAQRSISMPLGGITGDPTNNARTILSPHPTKQVLRGPRKPRQNREAILGEQRSCSRNAGDLANDTHYSINLPVSREELAKLKAGDTVTLTGVIYTARDAAHERLLAMLKDKGELPFALAGQTLFYAGPTGPKAGRALGSIGPTTSSRMDFAAPSLYENGIVATIGKGKRSAEVARACEKTNSVHFDAQGGIAALLAACVKESEIIAFDDLGTEAIRKLTVENFPVTVGIDTNGNCR